MDESGIRARIIAGGAPRYHQANSAKGKLFARDRIARLVDDGSFVEDGMFANALADGLPADGVITGSAAVDGRRVCLMANDSTVKAGSWGARTVEKIIRVIERAYATGVPMIYLVDSAGRGSPIRSSCFPAGVVPARYSTPRCGRRDRSRRSARCSGRPPRAVPTSRRSATSW